MAPLAILYVESPARWHNFPPVDCTELIEVCGGQNQWFTIFSLNYNNGLNGSRFFLLPPGDCMELIGVYGG